MRDKTKERHIVVKRCDCWTSSTSRKMRAAGLAASAEAIRKAAAAGICISYLENGVLRKCRPEDCK